jgi:hypothetical protein
MSSFDSHWWLSSVIKENMLVTVKSVRSVHEIIGKWQWQKRFKFMRKQLGSASLLSLYSISGFQWFLSVWTVEENLMEPRSLNIICRPRACLCMWFQKTSLQLGFQSIYYDGKYVWNWRAIRKIKLRKLRSN